MDAACEHVPRQPCLVLPAAIGSIGPDIGSGVAGVDYMAQFPPVAMRRQGHFPLADKAEAPVDADMRLVAEHRRGDLRQGGAIGAVADLAAHLYRPAGIDILLVRLVRLAWSDLLC